MTFDEAVFVSALIFTLLFPLATDEIVLEICLVSVIILHLPTIEVLDLEVGKGDVEDHVASRDGVQGDIDLLILKAVLAYHRQHDSATGTFNFLITVFFRWLSVFIVCREICR